MQNKRTHGLPTVLNVVLLSVALTFDCDCHGNYCRRKQNCRRGSNYRVATDGHSAAVFVVAGLIRIRFVVTRFVGIGINRVGFVTARCGDNFRLHVVAVLTPAFFQSVGRFRRFGAHRPLAVSMSRCRNCFAVQYFIAHAATLHTAAVRRTG